MKTQSEDVQQLIDNKKYNKENDQCPYPVKIDVVCIGKMIRDVLPVFIIQLSDPEYIKY
jgi:hypothetical protein